MWEVFEKCKLRFCWYLFTKRFVFKINLKKISEIKQIKSEATQSATIKIKKFNLKKKDE